MTTEIIICFDDAAPDQSSANAVDLKEHLAIVAPTINTEQRRTDSRAQDMGATLAIVLGAPAVVALAKGIAVWLQMQGTKPKLVIRNNLGQPILELDNMPSHDIRALLEGKLADAVGR